MVAVLAGPDNSPRSTPRGVGAIGRGRSSVGFTYGYSRLAPAGATSKDGLFLQCPDRRSKAFWAYSWRGFHASDSGYSVSLTTLHDDPPRDVRTPTSCRTMLWRLWLWLRLRHAP